MRLWTLASFIAVSFAVNYELSNDPCDDDKWISSHDTCEEYAIRRNFPFNTAGVEWPRGCFINSGTVYFVGKVSTSYSRTPDGKYICVNDRSHLKKCIVAIGDSITAGGVDAALGGRCGSNIGDGYFESDCAGRGTESYLCKLNKYNFEFEGRIAVCDNGNQVRHDGYYGRNSDSLKNYIQCPLINRETCENSVKGSIDNRWDKVVSPWDGNLLPWPRRCFTNGAGNFWQPAPDADMDNNECGPNGCCDNDVDCQPCRWGESGTKINFYENCLPDEVWIHVGTNDVLGSFTPQVTRGNVEQIISTLQDNEIFGNAIYKVGLYDVETRNLAGHIQALRDMSDDLKNVHYVDLSDFEPEMLLSDSLHPNDEGRLFLAQKFAHDCPQDVDGNGDVGFSDILSVLSAWGSCGQ